MKRKINCITYASYSTYTRSGQRFAIHSSYDDQPELFQCQVSEIHPYDLADYAWAKKDRPNSFSIIKNGKIIKFVPVSEYDEENYETPSEYVDDVIDTMCVALLRVNKSVEPRIDHT